MIYLYTCISIILIMQSNMAICNETLLRSTFMRSYRSCNRTADQNRLADNCAWPFQCKRIDVHNSLAAGSATSRCVSTYRAHSREQTHTHIQTHAHWHMHAHIHTSINASRCPHKSKCTRTSTDALTRSHCVVIVNAQTIDSEYSNQRA